MLLSTLAPALLLAARTAFAAAPVNPKDGTTPVKLRISVSFPQAEIFGVKLINGVATKSVLSFENEEPAAVNVHFIGGSLWSLPTESAESKLMHNLTATRFDTEIPPGNSETFTYKFTTELHPQDFILKLVAIVTDGNATIHQLLAYDERVGIADAPASILDPKIVFLYLILASLFAGIVYFVYSTWITTLFPQMATKKRSGGKDGSRAKASSRGSRKVNGATEQIAVVGADGPAVTSASKAYDESWIPANLINRPQGKRAPGSVKKTKAVA